MLVTLVTVAVALDGRKPIPWVAPKDEDLLGLSRLRRFGLGVGDAISLPILKDIDMENEVSEGSLLRGAISEVVH